MVYGPSRPLIWMSPVLQTLQFNCGRTPFTFCKASKMDGVGLALKNFDVYTSTGTGLSNLDTSFIVPDTTTSSKSVWDSAFSVTFNSVCGLFKITSVLNVLRPTNLTST